MSERGHSGPGWYVFYFAIFLLAYWGGSDRREAREADKQLSQRIERLEAFAKSAGLE